MNEGIIGFIGLGAMGSSMSRNILKSGRTVLGYDRKPESGAALAAEGGRAAASLEDFAQASVVISMLWDDEVTGATARALADIVQPGAIHIAMGTISTQLSQKLEQLHLERGQGFLAAPVFGRPDAARMARLSVMCAGKEDTFHQVEDILKTLGTVLYIGNSPRQANLLKLTGNNMIFASIELLSEMFSLLRKAGVAEAVTKAAIVDVLFPSPIFSVYADRIMNRDWQPGGDMNLALKDNSLCLATAEEYAVPLPIFEFMRSRINEAVQAGDREKDITALSRRVMADARLEG